MFDQPEGNSIISPSYSNFEIKPEVQEWFNTVDADHSGKINSKQLQAALINLLGKSFSKEACRLMINIFDREKQGNININEFQNLHNYVNEWLAVFSTYDKDASGFIDQDEFFEALHQMGYKLSKEFIKIVFDTLKETSMSLDQFIVICVKILKLTNAFKRMDENMTGVITIPYETFIELLLEDYL